MLVFVAERLVLHFINYGECREKREKCPARDTAEQCRACSYFSHLICQHSRIRTDCLKKPCTLFLLLLISNFVICQNAKKNYPSITIDRITQKLSPGRYFAAIFLTYEQ